MTEPVADVVPWYRSPIIRQNAVQFAQSLFILVGWNAEGIDLDATVGSLFSMVGMFLAAKTMYDRWTQKTKPAIALTKAKAEERSS